MSYNARLLNQHTIARGNIDGGATTNQLIILTPDDVANGYRCADKTMYYFNPALEYNVNGTITLQRYTSIQGQGATVNLTDIERGLFYCDGVYSGSIQKINSKLIGFEQLNNKCSTNKFIHLPRAQRATISECYAENYAIGIYIGGTSSTQSEYHESQNIITNNRFKKNYVDIIGYNNLEYSIISQNISNKSCYGIIMMSGNNNVTNNQITECPAPLTYAATTVKIPHTVGHYTLEPTNDGHSIIANNTCNHGGDMGVPNYWPSQDNRTIIINNNNYTPNGSILIEFIIGYRGMFNILGNTFWATEILINKFAKYNNPSPSDFESPYKLFITSQMLGGPTSAIRNYDSNVRVVIDNFIGYGYENGTHLTVEGDVVFQDKSSGPGPIWAVDFSTPLSNNTGIGGTAEHSVATWTGGNETQIKKYQQYRFFTEKLNGTNKIVSPNYVDMVVATDTSFAAIGGIARSTEISSFDKRTDGQAWKTGTATLFNVRISMSSTGTILIANDNNGTYGSTYGITRVERLL